MATKHIRERLKAGYDCDCIGGEDAERDMKVLLADYDALSDDRVRLREELAAARSAVSGAVRAHHDTIEERTTEWDSLVKQLRSSWEQQANQRLTITKMMDERAKEEPAPKTGYQWVVDGRAHRVSMVCLHDGVMVGEVGGLDAGWEWQVYMPDACLQVSAVATLEAAQAMTELAHANRVTADTPEGVLP
ncbi:MAG: hypothetical protein GY772_21735 [bacterium]|nr:hypothetical protein [bacterium]